MHFSRYSLVLNLEVKNFNLKKVFMFKKNVKMNVKKTIQGIN